MQKGTFSAQFIAGIILPLIRGFIYNGGETLDGCGYYFDTDKNLKII